MSVLMNKGGCLEKTSQTVALLAARALYGKVKKNRAAHNNHIIQHTNTHKMWLHMLQYLKAIVTVVKS